MQYGKIIDGQLEIAGALIRHDGKEYYNPPDALKKQLGYLPVAESDMPVKEGYRYTPEYQAVKGQILTVWRETPEPDKTPDDTETRLAGLEIQLAAALDEIETLKAAQTEQAAKLTAIETGTKTTIEKEL